jgi:hypothetical protein
VCVCMVCARFELGGGAQVPHTRTHTGAIPAHLLADA